MRLRPLGKGIKLQPALNVTKFKTRQARALASSFDGSSAAEQKRFSQARTADGRYDIQAACTAGHLTFFGIPTASRQGIPTMASGCGFGARNDNLTTTPALAVVFNERC